MPEGVTKTSPQHVWHVGSKAYAVGGGGGALPEHPQETEGEADLHGQSQRAKVGGQAAQLSEQVQKDGQFPSFLSSPVIALANREVKEE